MVLVRWTDIAKEDETYPSLDEIDLVPFEVETIGFLCPNARSFIVVVNEIYDDGSARYATAIPRAVVNSITELTEEGGDG